MLELRSTFQKRGNIRLLTLKDSIQRTQAQNLIQKDGSQSGKDLSLKSLLKRRDGTLKVLKVMQALTRM